MQSSNLKLFANQRTLEHPNRNKERARATRALAPTQVCCDSPYGTDQVPANCQPLLSPELSTAIMNTPFVPKKLALKPNARFKVKFVPEDEVEEFTRSTVHWLFCSMPAAPTVPEPTHPLPASLSKKTWLDAGW